MFKKIFSIVMVLLILVSCDRKEEVFKKAPVIQQGIWVTIFSKEKVLYSKAAVNKLMIFCKENGLKEIYLQVFRAGEPYYDSAFLKHNEYSKMSIGMGDDPVTYLLAQAKQNNLKVYAWINVLSLAQNKNAPILKKYGQSVLTRDKNLRTSIRTEEVNDSDRFYLRDDQLFLEPGDDRVVGFMLSVVNDIVTRYPGFDGLHLDYIRYPYPVPFIPDSRFLDTGVSYGFGEGSLNTFKKNFALDPLKDGPYQDDLHFKWDRWKRGRVTELVEDISTLVRQKANTWRISCAATPGLERAYSVASQDWIWWLQKGMVDYVILMNYTRDHRLFYHLAKAGLALQDASKIYIGMGVFMFKSPQELTLNQSIARELSPAGIVYFSYDEFMDLNKKLPKET